MKRQPHIALVEDTAALREMYETTLAAEGYKVSALPGGRAALDFLKDCRPDLLLLDLRLPDMDGIEILRVLRERRFRAPVIVMTGFGTVNTAIEVMRGGAREFLIKPFSTERLRAAVRAELERSRIDTMPPELPGLTQEEPLLPIQGFTGTAPVMEQVYARIRAAARSSASVFITGESGTGKEVCAQAIHSLSPRTEGPFVPVNCAAIPRELLESELFGHVKGAFTGALADRDGAARLADGGTLFLDEVAEMHPEMQTKLLRFLQDLHFQKIGGGRQESADIRIICATNRDPKREIEAGRLRADLYYRLHVLPIHMPPLRERGADILALARSLLARYSAEERKNFTGFTATAEMALRRYGWPGNVREMQNIIRHAVIMHEGLIVTEDMLTFGVFEAANDSHGIARPGAENVICPLAAAERAIIERAIALCDGNIPRAAAALDVAASTIYRKKAAWESTDRGPARLAAAPGGIHDFSLEFQVEN